MKLSRLVLLAALGTAAVSVPRSDVHAQPVADPVKEVARTRFKDGVAAYDAGRYEEARTAFEQAYTLSQSPAVLLNLGLAESKTNRCVAGGNHLLKFLREHKEITPEQRTAAAAGIEDCKKKVGLIAITVDAAGAEVSVDGASVGKSPVADPVFVEPGTHAVIATLSGRTASTSVEAKKGQTTVATITVKPAEPTPPTPPDPTGPAPIIPTPGINPDPLAPNPQPPPGGARDSGGESFGEWTISGRMPSPLFWVGSGVFAVGLGLGIGFSAAASSSASDAELLASRLRNQAAEDGVDGAPCGAEDGTGTGDVYPDQCNQLRDALGVHDANVAVAATGWVLAGLAAGGTIAVAVLGYDGKGPSKPSAAVLPLVSSEVQGVTVVGTF
ncbi:MAG: PEGA domain-containing protein [Polyangiaceae bacterium]|jgi:hypothetical protein|nr:PEGA domain-containing protein [Polyangiaceae bacterium]MBK8936139.1 PEGA domain-containing protein [Polyangiaceae bacterium]